MTHRKWRLIACLMALILLGQLFVSNESLSALGKPGQIVKVTNNTHNVRSGPGHNYQTYGQVVANSYFTIYDVVYSGNEAWYKIPYRGTEAYLSANASHTIMNTNGPFVANNPKQNNVTDWAFESSLAGFPDSYKPYLRYLHTKYPQWRFEPAPVPESFDTAVDKQYANEQSNTTQYYDNSQYHWRYLYMVRNWRLVDEGHNYPSNRPGIAFFMDPRNFLNETDIFQFEKLTYAPEHHTLNAVLAVAGQNAQLRALASPFMTAAKVTNVSPVFLMSRAKQEITESPQTIINSARGDIDLAWPPLFNGETSISFLPPEQQLEQLNRYLRAGNRFTAVQQKAYDDLNKYFLWEKLEQKLASGTHLTNQEKIDLELYRATQPMPIATPSNRYYNLFNIQATPAIGVIDGNRINGVIYATGHKRQGSGLVPLDQKTLDNYNLPWDSYEDAAIGGAKFMGNGYILAGQDTLYHQKFNVNGPTWHQYMSNLTAPYSEGRHVHTGYKNAGLLNIPHVFKIPVFQNMPASTAIPDFVSLNISNDPNEEPGTALPPIDPDEFDNEQIDSPQVPLDPDGNALRYGDINGDGYINAADRLMVTRHILKSHALEGVPLDYADVNRDGYANAADRLLITRHILGTGRLP